MTDWLARPGGRSRADPRRGARPGSRWRRRGSRSPRCWAPGRGRSCSRAAPPRRSPPPAGEPPSAAVTRCWRPSSTRRCASAAEAARRGHGRRRRRPRPRRPRRAARRRPRRHRARPRPVGQPRGGHRASPSREVVAACRERGVLVHVDAAAGAGHVPIAFDELGADLLSVSAHKLGGPAGIGALLVRRGLRIRPLLRRRRPGAGPAGRPRAGRGHRRLRRRRGRAV